MTPETVVQIMRQCLMAAFWLSAPLLVIGFVAGLVISLVQIATSMQDNAFSTIPRLAAFLAGLLRRVLQPVAGGAVLQDEPPFIGGVPERLAQSVGDGDQLRHRFTPRCVRPTRRRPGTGSR